jgi:Protein of unknown function (DUF1592)/Protein of unknown function (DUF1588)/Protein of unknown function (DUF1595)/Protein of unknown function (DUF1587)/Protein of unknown function (DUF1585)
MRGTFLGACFLPFFPVLLGCSGEIGAGGAPGSGSPGGGLSGSASATPDDNGLLGVSGTKADCAPSPPQPVTRVARLTHTQYDNSVRDLLHIETQPSQNFLPDPVHGAFNNTADDLRVVDRLGRDYRAAAESIATTAAMNRNSYAGLAACNSGDATKCGPAFVESFGRRAFRRPLTSDEQKKYAAMFTQGDMLFTGGDPISDGVHLVVEAMLQSPKFLYRVEIADTKPLADATRPLDPYELASRLSYMIWSSTPDDQLLDAALSGKLGSVDDVAKEAARLLDDPRAKGTVGDFYAQWLHADLFTNASADRTLFPNFTDAVVTGLATELDSFVKDIFDRNAPPTDVLTASHTFVDRNSAPVYGLTGTYGDTLVRAELDPQKRAGFLTQLGFLASHSHATATSPIHRGVFLQREVLCATVPPPPGNVDLTLPPFDATIKTTRDQVTAHTAKQPCLSCHGTIINPAGFAFENYDPIGAYRATERNTPIDPTGSITIDGQAASFQNAVDLVHQIAKSDQGRQCYAGKWLQYGYGRIQAEDDACTLKQLGLRMGEPGYSLRQLIGDLVRTKSFMRRSAQN